MARTARPFSALTKIRAEEGKYMKSKTDRVDHLIHGARRLGAASLADDFRGHTRHRHIMRHRLHHDGTGRDPRAMANLDIAEDFGAGPDHHAAANFWMTVLVLLAGAAERDAMQDGEDVVNKDGLAGYESRSVYDGDAADAHGGGLDIC